MQSSDAIQFAEEWEKNPKLRPAPPTAREVVLGLLTYIRALEQIATGEVAHVYRGQCPDAVTDLEARDPDCPACKILGDAGHYNSGH